MGNSRLQSVVIDGYKSSVLQAHCCTRTSSSIGSLVNSDQAMTEFKHIISHRDDNKLSIFRSVFDVVGYNRNVSEVKRSVDLVHEVQRRWFEDMKGENQCQRTQSQ